jgi:hypothetical protein
VATLEAIFAVFHDSATPTARGFSRDVDLRLETSWRLLHDVRAALPPPPCPTDALLFPLLGGEGGERADVAIGHIDGGVAIVKVVYDDDAVGDDEVFEADLGPLRAEVPVVFGHLRAWITATFRGVSAEHLDRYLAEFVARYGRVLRRSDIYVDAAAS